MSEPPIRPVRIMHVDDEPDLTAVIKKRLEERGFQVDAFNEPLEALAQYKPSTYDVLITCIRMPNMNGFELARNLRKIDKEMRIIILTAFQIDKQEANRVFPVIGMEIDGYLNKPIGMRDLEAFIEAVRAKKRDGTCLWIDDVDLSRFQGRNHTTGG